MLVVPEVVVSRKRETTCCKCKRDFWAWDSNRTACYMCEPEPKTTQEQQIRVGDLAAVTL